MTLESFIKPLLQIPTLIAFMLFSANLQGQTELKYTLNLKQFQKLRKNLKKNIANKVSQRNYYFDTKDLFLQKNGASFRLRIIEKGPATLTMKHGEAKRNLKASLFKRRSFNCYFPGPDHPTIRSITQKRTQLYNFPTEVCKTRAKNLVHPIKGLKKFLEIKKERYRSKPGNRFLSLGQIVYLGKNFTERTNLFFRLGKTRVNGVLDKTIFPNNFFNYELEVKLNRSQISKYKLIKNRLEQLFKKWKVGSLPPSKFNKSSITFFILGKRKEEVNSLLKNKFLFR